MAGGGEDPPALLGPAEIRQIAARLGIRPAKRLGQNFVVDPGTVRRIVAAAGLHADDVVLEVGPGLGSLTLGLVGAARRVIAIEVDRALAAELPRTVADRAPRQAARLEVVTADAARIGALPGEPPSVLVANLPYNVAVPVVLHLLATVPTLARGLVMVQAEVADRMTAPPGSRVYGVPSVKLAWYATARRAGPVPRTVFWPVPNVDSALVSFTRHQVPAVGPGAASELAGGAEAGGGAAGGSVAGTAAGAVARTAAEDAAGTVAERVAGSVARGTGGTVAGSVASTGGGAGNVAEAGRDGIEAGQVFAVVDAAFAQRRKTLRAALARWAGTADAAQRILAEAGVDPGARGESLTVADFARIAAAARRGDPGPQAAGEPSGKPAGVEYAGSSRAGDEPAGQELSGAARGGADPAADGERAAPGGD